MRVCVRGVLLPQTSGIDGMINATLGYAFDAMRGGEKKG
jgi:hypothetical protein